jgi:NAD(P)H-hydrate epimerase
MENAGRSAALLLHRLYPDGRVVAIAGSGNNGGDALVLARTLHAWGRDVHVVAAGSKPPDAALLHAFTDLLITDARDGFDPAGAAVIVDGMLGTGTRGAPRPPLDSIIEAVNRSRASVVALDLPSGVDATSGRVPGVAVRADVTISFGWPKLGLMLNPARGHCGRMVAIEIGFQPVDADIASAGAQLITPAWAGARIAARRPDAHKGTAGRLLILAGSDGMAGAAALAAESALHAGAGLAQLSSPVCNREILQTLVPEATFIARETLGAEDLSRAQAVVAGPGMGTDAAARAALEHVLDATGDVPVLLDADALNMLAEDPDTLVRIAASRPVVVTPHPLELSRLTGVEVADILGDRVAAARAAATRFGCVVLVKGQPSIVAADGTPLLVTTSGSSDVATGGMGDQLAGVIGAFLAAGLSARDAAGAGLFMSGRAADLARRGRSLSPRVVSANLYRALLRPGADRSAFDLPFVTFDQPPRW